jgi:hypothetical protein
MALYMARQPDGDFAVFDDLSVKFVATGLRMGEAAAFFTQVAKCTAHNSWNEMTAAGKNVPIGSGVPDVERIDARFDDLLNAVALIRGRAVMKMELCSMGLGLYEPQTEPSEAVLELYDCYMAEEADMA